MSRFGSWFRAAAPKPSVSPAVSQASSVAQEIANIEDAMASAALIMNDDIDGAEEKLRTGDSTFHHLGQSLCVFMRSVLGFEKSIMVEASARLYDCENVAWNDMKKAQKEAGTTAPAPGRVYPPGSEYALVHAEAELMSAIVAVLHESLTEAVKGFYKLRKAFITLDGLMQVEDAYLKSRGLQANRSKESVSALSEKKPDGIAEEETDDADLEFVDADESHQGTKTPLTYEGHLSKYPGPEEELAGLSSNGNAKGPATKQANGQAGRFSNAPDSDAFTHPIDIFIHSGTNMCFGILLLIMSMVPPAFSRLLSIVGFRGDRERGVHMLWQSTKFHNINGGVASLMLFGYYNGMLGSSDILPNDEDVEERGAIVGYPRERCAALLAKMRALFPDSGLLRMQEAASLSNNKDLRGAIRLLKSNAASKMRQVTALNTFELSLGSMYVHEYADMHEGFIRCIELNDWSHALYYYLAGCAELENYRNAFHSATTTAGEEGEGDGTRKRRDESAIRLHKKRAEELFRKAPTVVGKKKLLARPMPFEVFVARKLQKWEDRSRSLGVDLADAAGVSPAMEMTYLWNGTKKMGGADLERCRGALGWDRLTAPSERARAAISAEPDERGVRDVCMAAVLRHLGRYGEARKILREVMGVDRTVFKGANKDDYPPPAAHYEMAVLAWIDVQNPTLRHDTPASEPVSVSSSSTSLAGSNGGGADTPLKDEGEWRRKKIDECQAWLDTVSKWEAFTLDARFGMRINTGLDTIRWYRKEHGWASE